MTAEPSPSVIVIAAAVAEELDGLVRTLAAIPAGLVFGQPIWRRRGAARPLLLAATGLGKANAAATTAWLLAAYNVALVLHLGCAGAYAESPLRLGDVMLTDTLWFGDEGVLTQHEVQPSSAIGLPLLTWRGRVLCDQLPLAETDLFQRLVRLTPPGRYRLEPTGSRALPLPAAHRPGAETWLDDPAPSAVELAAALDFDSGSAAATSADQFHLRIGPSVTLGLVSGDPEVARRRFLRYGAWAENLEGSAVVQTCFRAEVPVIECRAISNLAGDRDKRHWRLTEAMAHCHGLVGTWLEQLDLPVAAGSK